MSEVKYLAGFKNNFQSEAISGALPVGQNSPQHPPLGLYAEQLSGSAFTRPRDHNLHSWLYRTLPSTLHTPFKVVDSKLLCPPQKPLKTTSHNQMRWGPLPIPTHNCDFISSLITWAQNGNSSMHSGAAIHLYSCNRSMLDTFFYNADGELLIVPESGELIFLTEMGRLDIEIGEIIVIPRGIKFQVQLKSEHARGYILENYASPLTLPELGPIGANGLANPRDFLYPCAAYVDHQQECSLLAKFNNQLLSTSLDYNPLNVVAWHGNYAPYKYDLRKFNTINTVSFDHPDPSIFTVLSSQTNTPGVANIDFVIFPERWSVANNTFRPPYYHRNIMSEYMGLIYGEYDAKETGFIPGSCSVHNCMSAHGPDADAFNKATDSKLQPQYLDGTLAFMFESIFAWQITNFAEETPLRQQDYYLCWSKLPKRCKLAQKQ